MNKRNLLIAALCAAGVISSVSATAQEAKDLINTPNAGAWSVFGPTQKTSKVKDNNVQGGGAMQVAISAPTAQAWQDSASAPVEGKITKGDKVLVVVWMKTVASENDAPGQANLRLQINSAPYTALAEQMQSVSKDWKMYALETVATQDYAKGSTNVSIHLGYAKQTLQLGPVLVFDMAPGQ
jgi:hypothetical protein